MSRYLEYSSPTLGPDRVVTIRTSPPPLGPVCILGPEERFKAYLGTKRYQGKSTVCCWGRFATGQKTNVLCTMVMTFIPGIYYMQCVLPLAFEPEHAHVTDTFSGCIQTILAWIIMISFLSAAFTNPGIIPRNSSVPKELENKLDMRSQFPHARFLRINGITVKQKFCTSCLLFRPPRSKHCCFCDNCVLRFDHHCTWLGNCIGLNNYRYFVCLMYSSTIYLMMIIYTVLHVIVKMFHVRYGDDGTFFEWIVYLTEAWLEEALLIYCFFLLVAVALLTLYHTVISMQNLTTNEHVKNYYRDNPFDFGWFKNCRQIYCFPETVIPEGEDRLEADDHPFSSSYTDDGGSFEDG